MGGFYLAIADKYELTKERLKQNITPLHVVEFALLVAILFSYPAFAAPPVDAGSLLRQNERARQLSPPSLPEQEEKKPLPELTDINGDTILVKGFQFTGALNLVTQETLLASVSEAIDQELDFDSLQLLAERVTRLLKKEGWILARAYLPIQDISNGIITIGILSGRLDNQGKAIIIEPINGSKLRIEPDFLQGIASQYLTAGEAIREADLERSLLLMQSLPGIDVNARLEAGDAPDSTRIHIMTSEDTLLSSYMHANNFGSYATGRDQVSGQVTLNDPFGRGSRWGAGITHSEGLDLGQLFYSTPLGYQGWFADQSYTHLRYEVVDGIASDQADYDGQSRTINAAFRYPLVRSRMNNVWFSFAYRTDLFEDRFNDILITDKRVDAGQLSLFGDSVDYWQGGGLFAWSLAFYQGSLDLSKLPEQKESDANSFNTSGHFGKFEYDLSRLQTLNRDLSFFIAVNGQASTHNLDSSQKFFPGGPNGVRAYPIGEAPADEGQLVRTELRYDVRTLPYSLGNLQFQLFNDNAWVSLSHSHPSNIPIDTASGENRYHISGAGIGLSLTKADRYRIGASWSHKLGDNPGRNARTGFDSDEQSDRHRFWLQALAWF